MNINMDAPLLICFRCLFVSQYILAYTCTLYAVVLSRKFTNESEQLASASKQFASAHMSLTCIVCHTQEYEKC